MGEGRRVQSAESRGVVPPSAEFGSSQAPNGLSCMHPILGI